MQRLKERGHPAHHPTHPAKPPLPLHGERTQLASITKTEEICRTALKPDYLTALITPAPCELPGDDHDTEAAIRDILTLCDQARGKSSDAVGATGGEILTTADETAAEKALVALLQYLSRFQHSLPGWQTDSKATALLARALENDH